MRSLAELADLLGARTPTTRVHAAARWRFQWLDANAPRHLARIEFRPAAPRPARWDALRRLWSGRPDFFTLEFHCGFGGDGFRIDRVGVEFPLDRGQRRTALVAGGVLGREPSRRREGRRASLRDRDCVEPLQPNDAWQWTEP